MGFLKKHEGWFPYHLCIERFRLEFAQIHLSPPGNCLEIRVKCLICSNHREVSRRFGMISSLQLPWKLGTANVGTPWGEFSTLRKDFVLTQQKKQGPAMDLIIMLYRKKTDQQKRDVLHMYSWYYVFSPSKTYLEALYNGASWSRGAPPPENRPGDQSWC